MKCGSSELCSLEQYITPSGYLRHKAACKDTHNCGGVTVQSTDMVICSECCDTDLCSTTLCNQKDFDLQYGSLCYHCDYPVDQPDHCDTIRVCQDNEVCSVVKTITGEYRVGCSAKNVCETAAKAGVCASCCTDMLCNRYCTNSIGTGNSTSGGTAGQSSACTDSISNCEAYTTAVCSNPHYTDWVSKHCPAFCNQCSSIGTGVGTGSGTSGGLTGNSTACSDRIPNCVAYTTAVCSDHHYDVWVSNNCPAFCNKCYLLTASVQTGTGTSGGITDQPSGCLYKSTVYLQGQTWNDGCEYSCTCTNGSIGLYTCKALCFTWDLPSACHMIPPVPGKCCPTPSCPAGFSIQYPPEYHDL